ncbi:MAG: hypothetical protein ABJB22_06680 [Verrucomicrobiota bacterium]
MNSIKLSKDQIQKIGLSAIGFVALLYVYFSFFLGPLNKSRASIQANINGLQDKIASSKNEMNKALNLDRQAGTATTRFAALKAMSPEGAPIAWFPPRMKTFFANHQIDKAVARLDSNSEFKQPELAAWAKYSWFIDLPQADYVSMGKAIAELENTEPLLSIARLSIHAVPEEAQFQQANLSVATIIKKR